MSTAGYGNVLKRGDGGGSEVFTTIAGIVSASGPGSRLEMVDVTDMDSNGIRKRLPTLRDEGEVTLELNFKPGHAQQSAASGLRADMQNKTLRNFKMHFNNAEASIASFAAYVTGHSPSFSVDGKTALSVTLTIDGAVTWT